MKLILRNSSLEMQRLALTTKEKTVSGASSPIVIEDFANIRTKTKLVYKITVINKGNWTQETIPFRFGKGSSSTSDNITSFIGSAIPLPTENGASTAYIESTVDYSNTSTYPDGSSLKITIVSTNTSEGNLAKTILYKIEYGFFAG